ncbi:MAG: sigma-70 family RNA polymerase sigma factor [Cyclobacteriaceae bacterium]
MTRKKILKLYQDESFEKWFENVYESNFENLYRYAFSITKSKTLAEDTVAEVFLNIWNNQPNYDDINELQAYLHVSVKHQAIRVASHDHRKFTYSDYDETLQISDAIDPESLLIGKELEQLISRTLDKLTPHRKLVYDLSKNKGYSNQQIAHELGISKRTVENHLFAVIKKIKASLNDHFKDSGKMLRFISRISTITVLLVGAHFCP